MICPKCQGRKVVRVGPRPQDEKPCSDCGGTGTRRYPGYLGLEGFTPESRHKLHDTECRITLTELPPDFDMQDAIDRGLVTFDWPGNQTSTARVSPVKPPTLEELLVGIDVVNHKLRDQHIETLREAARRNVSIVPDHRIQEGDFTILVSPGDYAQIKQRK